jgi:hypothetical protein
MSKFDNMNKETLPDPLTGGTMDFYTNQDGTFAMCIPHQAIPIKCQTPKITYEPITEGIRVWSFEPPKTEDAEYEILTPKQLTDEK